MTGTGRQNVFPGSGRGRGSVLPSWYPRTPLRDITAVVRARKSYAITKQRKMDRGSASKICGSVEIVWSCLATNRRYLPCYLSPAWGTRNHYLSPLSNMLADSPKSTSLTFPASDETKLSLSTSSKEN